VAVRVRPFNSREQERNAVLCIKMENDSTYITDGEGGEPKMFTFDYSYWSHDGYVEQPDGYLIPDSDIYADQKRVFKDLGEGVLENAWNGYNCSLFAYGQTGSGKSYSMVGYGVNKGIVPITCERLFQDIDSKKKDGSETEYQVSLSMLEIYNEQVRDLLNPSTLKVKGGMKVRQHPKLGFYVDKLLSVPVGSYADIETKIAQGTKSRTVASTNMNATSSRAHTIVAINFQQKGTNEQTKQKTTKTSVINLVDLAGSERADSTGATGDRLKEGSAINQSLSCLGNVIKALSDQASGNKVAVPFRDSVLTKLLKNALGGNSKTVMIAALSPASINYEETLSTLRFADRAKAIKTKAVVNESPTEKIIRELREENAQLLAKLKAATGDPAAMAKLLAEVDGEGEKEEDEDDGKKKFDEEEVETMKKQMEDELKRNQEEMEKMKDSWEEKLKKQAEQSKLREDELRDENELKKSVAHLWNLNEDSQLTNMVTHFLRPGTHTVGNKKADPPPSVLLTGLSIQTTHAQIQHDDIINEITITPCATNAKIMVNGKQIVDTCKMHHGDRVLFGTNHLFVLHHPKDEKLLQKQEQAKKEGRALEEIIMSYEKAQEEIAKNSGLLGSGMFDFDGISGSGEESSFQMDMLLREDLLKILPMISEANAMSEELDKKMIFEPVLISPQARGDKNGRTELYVKMKDLVSNIEWIWEKNKFINRKYLMQEMYNNFVDGDEQWDMPEQNDPFWEAADTEVLIGTVHLFLQSLAFKIDLSETLSISDYRGTDMGTLDCQIVPCTKDGGDLDDDDFNEDPSELIGNDLHFQLKISAARGLPKTFSKGESFCRYKMYLEDSDNETNRIQNTINPDFNYEKMFCFAPVTSQLIDYLLHSPLIIEVWGKQYTEKIVADKPKMRKASVSTKQLMSEDRVLNPRLQSISESHIPHFSEEDRYKLLCDMNVYKRRSERMEKKLKRLKELVQKRKEKDKTSVKVKEIEGILYGPDKVDMQRFHAAADVVLGVGKIPKLKDGEEGGSGGGAKVQGSTACVMQ